LPRLTKIYTRTGDDGLTGLGSGRRVPKTAPRIAAYGAVDELNSHIGAALAAGPNERLAAALRSAQNTLFHCGAELCLPEDQRTPACGPRIEDRHTLELERLMDELSETLPALENFILPGGAPAAAQLQVARAVCRRAELDVLRLAEREPVSAPLRRYLNRLSDALFVMARYENASRGVAEPIWDSRA